MSDINIIIERSKAFLASDIQSIAEAIGHLKAFIYHHEGGEPEASAPAVIEPEPVTPEAPEAASIPEAVESQPEETPAAV